MKFKHQSAYGTIAFVLSLLLLLFIIINLFYLRQINILIKPFENIKLAFELSRAVFYLIVPIFILISGILGLFQKNNKKGFAIAGLAIEGMILLAWILILTYIYFTQGSLGF